MNASGKDIYDICADILELLKRRPEGVLVTRISHGAGLPFDRTTFDSHLSFPCNSVIAWLAVRQTFYLDTILRSRR